MNFDLSEEQLAFEATARQFARDDWLPSAPGWDEREEFPAEALRRAQLLVRQNPRFAQPYYWAPFILMGEWSR